MPASCAARYSPWRVGHREAHGNRPPCPTQTPRAGRYIKHLQSTPRAAPHASVPYHKHSCTVPCSPAPKLCPFACAAGALLHVQPQPTIHITNCLRNNSSEAIYNQQLNHHHFHDQHRNYVVKVPDPADTQGQGVAQSHPVKLQPHRKQPAAANRIRHGYISRHTESQPNLMARPCPTHATYRPACNGHNSATPQCRAPRSRVDKANALQSIKTGACDPFIYGKHQEALH